MSNNYFQFKQFKIVQNHAAMRVNTDGVLLGAWSDVTHASNILDIGTGTGLVALMLAQRAQTASIDAVEIEEGAIKDALLNFENSPWNNRLSLDHKSIQQYVQNCTKQYDLIVCNPPYFNNALKSATASKQLARHTDSLSFFDLFQSVKKVLSPNGKFSLVLPSESENQIKSLAANHKMFASRIVRIRSNEQKPIIRILIEFHANAKNCANNTLNIYKLGANEYSNEFVLLTKDFYLHL